MTPPSPRPKLTRPRPGVAQPTGKAAPTGAGVRRPVAERIAPEDALLICFYKPYGVLSQFTPEGKWQGLKDYIDLPGVYVAGRLDADSEGLLLLTNDGKLQAQIADPRFKMEKTYWVQVEGTPDEAAVAVLKGSGTLVALPDGRLWQNTTGGPGLARGGSGDLLAGMLAGLLAQGLCPEAAACCGVWLHGAAADRCAARRGIQTMLPHELVDDLCALFAEQQR